jgi:alanine dehydrogenase
MTIGIPKEIKEQEQRVGLLPSSAQALVARGHTVLVQKNAGVGSGYSDEEYIKAGAQIIESAQEIFQRADMIVKVKEPLPPEWPLLRRGQILFTYLHLAASKPLTEALLNSGVTGVAYETIQIGNRLPLLEPMSEIAGRMSVVMGAYYLAKHNGGTGVLLGGVPGVLPGRVVVLGGGHRRRECGTNGYRSRCRRHLFSKSISNGCVFWTSPWKARTPFIPARRICTT